MFQYGTGYCLVATIACASMRPEASDHLRPAEKACLAYEMQITTNYGRLRSVAHNNAHKMVQLHGYIRPSPIHWFHYGKSSGQVYCTYRKRADGKIDS